jgi:hypothetical protein
MSLEGALYIPTVDIYEEENSIKLHNYLEKNLMGLMLKNSLQTVIEAKVYVHGNESINYGRDLQGYNVLRDGNVIGFTTDTSYDDSNVAAEVEYCYTVEAVYDEGISSSTNIACASAFAVPDAVDLSVGNGSSSIGDNGNLSISLDNEDPVAGFQFTLSLTPENGEVIDVLTTDRTQGFNLSTANGIILGFSLTGDVIDAGTGPILDVVILGLESGTSDKQASDVPDSNPNITTSRIGPVPASITSPVKLKPKIIPLAVDKLNPWVLSVVRTSITSPFSGVKDNVNWNPATGSSLSRLILKLPLSPIEDEPFPTLKSTASGTAKADAQAILVELEIPSSYTASTV